MRLLFGATALKFINDCYLPWNEQQFFGEHLIMNNCDFSNEIADFIQEEYQEFIKLQNIVWDIFLEFYRLASTNNLQYFVAYGSLLGVIRDNGFIPWDYDMDLFVAIDDREKLIAILKAQLSDEYYYAYIDNLADYPASCLRICKRGYSFTAIHLDVFFLVGCPENEPLKFLRLLKYYNDQRLTKYGINWFPQLKRGKIDKFLDLYKRLRSFLISDFLLRKKEEELWHKYSLRTSRYCGVAGSLDYYETNLFKDTLLKYIKGVDVSIPIGYDTFLKIEYGNYNNYLPIQKRFLEFYETLKVARERKEIMQEETERYSKFK